MSFNLDYDLYLDVAAPGGLACLLEGKASALRQDKPSYIQADCFPLNLYFRQSGAVGNNSTAVELAALNIVLGAKLLSALDDTTLLFSCTDFVSVGEGDDLHYQALLDLNTSEITAALDGQKSITARVNVEIETAENTQRLTYQFDVTIQKQSYGGEASPTPGTPTYPVPAQLVVKLRGTVALTPGQQVILITGLNLGSAPAQILPSLRKPAAGADALSLNVLDNSLSTDGFAVELSAPVPAAGYNLDYLVIL